MPSSPLRSHLYTITVFSIICIFFLGAYHSVSKYYELAISLTSVSCQDWQISTTFARQKQYMSMSSDNDHLWSDLLPANGGMVEVTRPDGTDETYGISMFHQLHCLQMIRAAFQDLQNPAARKHKSQHHHHSESLDDDDESHPRELHWTHCLDYLRQAILCNADGTVEPSRRNRKGELIVDGMVEHQCRDSGLLYAAARGLV